MNKKKPENHTVGLSLRNLKKSYGDLVAVKDLTLGVFRGEIFGFLGPNGAGKTTTINMICGLLQSDKGEILIDGYSLKQNYRRCKSKMGLCPQQLVIWESLTLYEQLIFAARLYDIPGDRAKKKTLELLEILGLSDRRNRLAKNLSGGMKRRLNIALAMVHEPDFLILDEPMAGLDPQSRLLVREYISSLADKKTVILTTHDMDEADRLANRIAIIDHGQLLVLDTSDNLKKKIGKGDILEIKMVDGQEDKIHDFFDKRPQNLPDLRLQQERLLMVGENVFNELSFLLDKLRENQIQIQDITIRKKTLEDVFIHLTGRRLRE